MKSPSTHNDTLRPMRGLFWLLAFTLVVRVGVFFIIPNALAGDPDGYRHLAGNVVDFGTFGTGTQSTAYRPPLYPLLLVPCVAFDSSVATVTIGGLHVLLGLGTVWLVWLIAQRIGLGRWALMAGLLVACDPILLGQSTQIMTETAATFFVALALLLLVRAVEVPSMRRFAITGVAMAACGLCRPELLLWAVLCVLMLFIRRGTMPKLAVGTPHITSTDKEDTAATACSGTQVLIMLLAMAVVLTPWVIRNQIQFGRPIVATTHGGYTLLLANNPSFYEYLYEGEPGTIWDADQLGPDWAGKAHHASPAAELTTDRRAYSEAWQNIVNQPAAFAYACLVRKGRFWALAPHQGTLTMRRAIGAWYLAEFVFAIVGLFVVLRLGEWPNRTSFWLWGLLLAVSLTAVHTVFWSNMRMRGPLVPVIVLAASVGIAFCATRSIRHKSLSQ